MIYMYIHTHIQCMWFLEIYPQKFRKKIIGRIVKQMWQNDKEKLLGIMNIFIVLTVSQVFTNTKTPSNATLNMCSESTIISK